ncbi:MAG: hypothetical protein EAZ95_11235 [Bacteroidetes bacterium]|nr:MAG: hypothetical protein EAZ95_11235 [Bacteroidota bacterium]
MLKTIGHHVCANQGNGQEIEQKGYPVALASNNSFLGKGYYFWDYNKEEATKWGNTHYKGSYYIFEADINCSETIMLDLVGNRKHIEDFLKLMKLIHKNNPEAEEWELGKLFDYIFEIVEEEGIQHKFPYKIIRALDYKATEKDDAYYFDPKSDRYTFLNPRIIICVVKCSQETITNFKLIETKR